MTIHTGPQAGSYFYGYDGNGNVTTLVSATNGVAAAAYQYDPFGRMLKAAGSLAGTNSYRFSTKVQDEEMGWSYYGYRYYNPETGRWLSRDPIEEKGGVNIYAACRNATINHHDILGRDCFVKMQCSFVGDRDGAGITIFGTKLKTKICAYQCNTVLSKDLIHGTGSGVTCDDLPSTISYPYAVQIGPCKNCASSAIDYVSFGETTLKSDCSKETCGIGCDIAYKLAEGACKESIAPEICKAAAALAKAACIDSCNAICKRK